MWCKCNSICVISKKIKNITRFAIDKPNLFFSSHSVRVPAKMRGCEGLRAEASFWLVFFVTFFD